MTISLSPRAVFPNLRQTTVEAAEKMVRKGPNDISHDAPLLRDSNCRIVPASHGYAFEVKAGSNFRVVDLHGQQVVDFAAWVLPLGGEKLSMSYTRYHLSGATPAIDECLMTNKDDALFQIVKDTCKTHDMTFMSCYPELYEKAGRPGHRSCAANIAEVMAPYGMKSYLEVTDPFNIFQNTPMYSIKALNCSRKGDYIEFKVLKDAVCAVSCCPYDLASLDCSARSRE